MIEADTGPIDTTLSLRHASGFVPAGKRFGLPKLLPAAIMVG
jgi:hypothetical protein